MITVGWIFGMAIGGVLAAPLVPALGLAPVIAGILTVILAPVGALLAPFIGVLSFSLAILVGGLALLVVTAVIYGLAAVSLLPVPAAGTVASNLIELICRGILIGLATAANALAIATITGVWILMSVVILVGFLTTIPPVAASRLVFQPILGLLSWFFILTWLIMPLGIILFVVNLPFALAQSGPGAIRFDTSTMTVETQGGAFVNFLFTLSPLPGATGFNLGNFTFLSLPPGTAPSTASFIGANLSAHEVGHTVTVAAVGGFFGICNAVDENIPPLARGAAAYGEVVPESHSFNRGLPALPMW